LLTFAIAPFTGDIFWDMLLASGSLVLLAWPLAITVVAIIIIVTDIGLVGDTNVLFFALLFQHIVPKQCRIQACNLHPLSLPSPLSS
jgi:hypothetical protein